MSQEGFDNTRPLWIGVKGGGCSGMSYVMDFDEKKENDHEFEIEGIHCVMEKSHETILR